MLNGILTSNGYTDFLSTYTEDRGEGDELQMALAELAFEKHNRPMPPSGWRREAERLGLFIDVLKGCTPRGKDTKMGSILKGSVGRVVRPRNEADEIVATCELVVTRARNGFEYTFREILQNACREPKAGS